MSNYTKATDFSVKDGLLTGDPAKIIKGTEIDDEFDAISVAIQTKADLASPTFTGTPLAPTAAGGTNTTQIATTAFVKSEISSDITTERSATATLTNKTINLTSNTLTGTVAQFNTALSDGDFATIAGTETLTNKTLTTPTLTTPKVNVINEETSGSGVTVDGVLIKDNEISGQYTPIFRDTEKATTSGTTIEFTGIPSWAKRITIIFNAVTNDGSAMIVQVGSSTGYDTSGYTSASSDDAGTATSTAGFVLRSTDSDSDLISGSMVLHNVSGTTWISSHSAMASNNNRGITGGGRRVMTTTLDRVRLNTASGTTAFDGGAVNIMYE